jgi:hypothetical protein
VLTATAKQKPSKYESLFLYILIFALYFIIRQGGVELPYRFVWWNWFRTVLITKYWAFLEALWTRKKKVEHIRLLIIRFGTLRREPVTNHYRARADDVLIFVRSPWCVPARVLAHKLTCHDTWPVRSTSADSMPYQPSFIYPPALPMWTMDAKLGVFPSSHFYYYYFYLLALRLIL